MSTVVRLAEYKTISKRTQPDVFFDKKEFDQLLSIYSPRVMSGEWKNYAIRHDPSMAAFLIFRTTTSQPLFTIVKRKLMGSKLEFIVYRGRARMKQSGSLGDALSILDQKLKLVII
ncbi:MAG: DUF2794 domain-containing protein [Pseudomonadota bacterium]|nr:DUF2794 domain-containing protein [Pseudomonadota bacterium]